MFIVENYTLLKRRQGIYHVTFVDIITVIIEYIVKLENPLWTSSGMNNI